jgi:purine nucleosidase
LTAPETHGDAGLGNARLPDPAGELPLDHAVDFLVREIMAASEPITLVAVARLTNVALPIRREPRLAERLHQVIVMGGAIYVPGNTTALAEFNIYVDPHAAHVVLHSGLPLTLVPWDVTSKVLLTQAHVDLLLETSSLITRLIADATSFYIDFHREYFGYAGCSINDTCAVALAFRPDLAEIEPVYVDVELAGERSMGKTMADVSKVWGQPANVQLVRGFDADSFMALFLRRMQELADRSPAGL